MNPFLEGMKAFPGRMNSIHRKMDAIHIRMEAFQVNLKPNKIVINKFEGEIIFKNLQFKSLSMIKIVNIIHQQTPFL